MKKTKSVTININGNEVTLEETQIKFYLSETKKTVVDHHLLADMVKLVCCL